jgi:hypothetical protein
MQIAATQSPFVAPDDWLYMLTIINTFALDLDTVACNGLDNRKAGGNCNLRTASTNRKIPPSLHSSWWIETSNDS